MPCWSTEPPGSPTSIGHRMQEDAHGRPTSPLCGRSTEGLWFRQHDWSQVPQRQRCTECEQRVRLIRGDRPATWRRFKDDFVMLESGRVEIDDESRDYLVEVDVETGPKGAHCRRIAVRARPNKGDIGTQVLRESRSRR